MADNQGVVVEAHEIETFRKNILAISCFHLWTI